MGLVYLDYNSTTPIAPEVCASVAQSMKEDWANPSSDSPMGRKASSAIEKARTRVAQMVNARSTKDIIFTSGGTESNNMAILSAVEWGRQQFPNPHVVTSNVEHVATSAMVKHLTTKGLITYTEVAVNKNGYLEVGKVMSSIKPETVLVTVMMANNETGVIFPVQEIGRELQKKNIERRCIWFHVDAAQAIGKMVVDVQDMQVDFLTVVGHKFYGPRIGALYARDRQEVCPVVRGGGQEGGLRPGTENTPMIVGLGAAAQLVTEKLEEHCEHMKKMRNCLHKYLSRVGSFVVNCEASERLANTLSVSWPNCPLSGYQLLERCPRLVASTTAACHNQTLISDVLLKSGVSEDLARTTIRLSVGRETTIEDIMTAVDDLVEAVPFFGKSYI